MVILKVLQLNILTTILFTITLLILLKPPLKINKINLKILLLVQNARYLLLKGNNNYLNKGLIIWAMTYLMKNFYQEK